MLQKTQVRIPLSIFFLLLLISLAHSTMAAPPPATPEENPASNELPQPLTSVSDLSTVPALSPTARLGRSSFRGERHAHLPSGAVSLDADSANWDLLRLQATWRTLYSNDFSDPNDNGWFTDEDDTLKHAYVEGEYQILIKTDTHFSTVRGGPKLTDAGVEVEARFATDNLGTYGLSFGITDDWSGYYTFQIDGESNYEIWQRDEEGWTLLSGPTHSEHINAGQTTNKLRLERRGDQVGFYVNDQSLTAIRIPGLAGKRRMGVVASARGTQNVDARFDNFRVSVPATLAREDDFSDPESGWCELVDEAREMGYVDGEYRILIKSEGQRTWCVRTAPSLADFDVEVQARFEGEQLDKSYGLTLRFQDHDNFYYFGVGPVFGTYSLRKQEAGAWTSLIDWTASPAINQGETANRLRAVGIGSEIWLFVNDQFLTSVTDDSFSEGGFGLLVTNSADPDGAEIFFDDFAAYNVEGSQTHRIYLPLIGKN